MKLNEKILEIESRVRNSKIILIGTGDYHKTYFDNVVPLVKNDGLWLEFGVYRGRSIQTISGQTDNIVYGFDTFTGLPEEWNIENPKGCYSVGGGIPAGAIVGENQSMYQATPTMNYEPWNENVHLIEGLIEDTLPSFIEEHKSPIAFLHIDTDIYSACSFALTTLRDRIVDGTIICFDELLDYPDYKDHELKAFAEFLVETGYDFDPLVQHSDNYSQACVRIKTT
jgi:hypothetical protein